MSEINERLMEIAIEIAKQRVERSYGYNSYRKCDRKWLESTPIDSYDDKSYRVRTFVLEGSPCKGIVVANCGWNIAIPITPDGGKLSLVYADEDKIPKKYLTEYYKEKYQNNT